VATERYVRDLFYHGPALAATTFCAPGRRGIRLFCHIEDAVASGRCALLPSIVKISQNFGRLCVYH
jgi:hypothetical protein